MNCFHAIHETAVGLCQRYSTGNKKIRLLYEWDDNCYGFPNMWNYVEISVIFAIMKCSKSTVVQYNAKKMAGLVGSSSVYDVNVGIGRWVECVRYCRELGLTKCQIIAMEITTGNCRQILHTNYTLTYDPDWNLYNMGKFDIFSYLLYCFLHLKHV